MKVRAGRKSLARAFLVIVSAGLLGIAWAWLGCEGPARLSLLHSLFPVESSTSIFRTGAIAATTNVYVVEADFQEIVKRAHHELMAEPGWTRVDHNFDGKAGGGPFVDFSGPSGAYRIIRGDRTFPTSMRAKIPASERHKWVVISASEQPTLSTRFGEWWRRITQ